MKYLEYDAATGDIKAFYDEPTAGTLVLSDSGFKALYAKMTKEDFKVKLSAVPNYAAGAIEPGKVDDFFEKKDSVIIEGFDQDSRIADLEAANAAMLLALVEGGLM